MLLRVEMREVNSSPLARLSFAFYMHINNGEVIVTSLNIPRVMMMARPASMAEIHHQ
jgi:hypothetical protein